MLEQDIANIVDRLTKLTDDEIDSVIDLNYDVVKIENKFELNESSQLKRKIKNNVREYYL
ncbi:ABC-three component system protein [Streptococcus suis]|uniref:ABC-three component system protein n=1 Tax=Streptococcus suis TaxID=1307 RepID=UPI003CC6A298